MLASAWLKTQYPGLVSRIALHNRAAQYIQDPRGFGEWHDDFTDGSTVGSSAWTRTSILNRLASRYGAGKFGGVEAAGQGIFWQDLYAGTAPLVSAPRSDAWFMSSSGWLDHLPGGTQIVFCGLSADAGTGAAPTVAISGDGAVKYFGLVYDVDNAPNYSIKVWPGSGSPRLIPTPIPVVVGTHAITELASDGLRTFTFLLNGEPVFKFSDTALMFQTAANAFFLDRGATDEGGNEVRVWDHIYLAAQRT